MENAALRPRVTVYIPSHNYSRFLVQAIESVLTQSFEGWELLIIDDGSTDDTAQIAERFARAHPDKVRVFRNAQAKGLRACANLALQAARGDYILRLDADDYLDEQALLVLATYLDRHPDVALVYPNYFYVNERGELMGLENRKKIGTEAKLLDLPAHGARTLVRKRALKSVGGYDEGGHAQDGYELWLKVLNRYPVGNVSTPLFYYRQHDTSMSRDEAHIHSSRHQIKRQLVDRNGDAIKPRTVGVIPVKNTYRNLPDIALGTFADRPLLDYTLRAAQDAGVFDEILVATDDPRVVEYCAGLPHVRAMQRPRELSNPDVRISQVLFDAVERLERETDIFADILVLLSIHTPLRRAEHIQQAVDTLILFNVDTVISVYEDRELHFTHGEFGLEPLNKGMLQQLWLEREALYAHNGAIYAAWRDVITPESFYGKRIGHVVMPANESYQIKSPFERWLVEQIVREREQQGQAPAQIEDGTV